MFVILFARFQNAVVQKTQTIKGAYIQRLFKSTVETKYDDDSNRNCSAAGLEHILPVNDDKTLVNGGFVSQTGISPDLDSQQSFCERNDSPHNEIANNEGDQRKANTSITVEHLLALQKYLLFTIVRDCSILMTFRELHPWVCSKQAACVSIAFIKRWNYRKFYCKDKFTIRLTFCASSVSLTDFGSFGHSFHKNQLSWW